MMSAVVGSVLTESCEDMNAEVTGSESPSGDVNRSAVTDAVSLHDDVVTSADTHAVCPASEASENDMESRSMQDVNTEGCSGGHELSATGSSVPPAAGSSEQCDVSSDADLETMIARQRQLIDRVCTERQAFVRQIDAVEAEIERASQRVSGAVDNRVNELLAAAAELRTERAAQLEQVRSEVQSRLAWMNYHRMFAEQLLKHGTAAELIHYAPLLHADAERICSVPVPEIPPMSADAEQKLAAMQSFVNIDVDEMRQRVGNLVTGTDPVTEPGLSPYLSEPRLIAATAVNNPVCGVTVSDAELFVVSERSAVVEVYDVASEGLEPARQINVEQMTCPSSIAACSVTHRLFITDAQVLSARQLSSTH